MNMKKIIQIKGTNCRSCKALIEDVCKEVDGVLACNVDFKTGKTEIEYDNRLEWNKLKVEIESFGVYKVMF